MLRIAERTASRIGGFVEKVQKNSDLLKNLENLDLLDDFNENTSAFEEAEMLIENWNYTLATRRSGRL